MIERVLKHVPFVQRAREQLRYINESKTLERQIRDKVRRLLESYSAISIDTPVDPDALRSCDNLHSLYPETTAKDAQSIIVSTGTPKTLGEEDLFVRYGDGSAVEFKFTFYGSRSNAKLTQSDGSCLKKADNLEGWPGVIARLRAMDEVVSVVHNNRFPAPASGGICY